MIEKHIKLEHGQWNSYNEQFKPNCNPQKISTFLSFCTVLLARRTHSFTLESSLYRKCRSMQSLITYC